MSLLNTLKWAIYLDAARSLALAQISSSLKPNHHSRVKLVQIPDIYDTNKWTEKNISESQKYENHEIDMNPGGYFLHCIQRLMGDRKGFGVVHKWRHEFFDIRLTPPRHAF